ncbi:hypothetical protein CL616_01330 [archaeon]|nr:hypothetical protein [archaeon]
MDRIVLGLTEKISINNKEFSAKIDTGARGNSLCKTIASELKLPLLKRKIWIKSSNGMQLRRLVEAEIKIKNLKFKTTFNVTDRSHLRFPVLIGVQTLQNGFLVDPSKNQTISPKAKGLYSKRQ